MRWMQFSQQALLQLALAQLLSFIILSMNLTLESFRALVIPRIRQSLAWSAASYFEFQFSFLLRIRAVGTKAFAES